MAEYIIGFSKKGMIKYTSHLDMMRMFRRAFKRAGLDLVYSNGFNPHPKMSLALPLPLGYTSVSEWMEVETIEKTTAEDLQQRLQAEMPPGIDLFRCELREQKVDPEYKGSVKKAKTLASRCTGAKYAISVMIGEAEMAALLAMADHDAMPQEMNNDEWTETLNSLMQCFLSQEEILVQKMKKQKRRRVLADVNIRDKIQRVDVMPFGLVPENAETGNKKIVMTTVLDAGSGSNLNPDLMMKAFFAWVGFATVPESLEIERLEVYFDEDGKTI